MTFIRINTIIIILSLVSLNSIAGKKDEEYKEKVKELEEKSLVNAKKISDNIARDTIDAPTCQHDNSASIAMGMNGQVLEITAMTIKYQITTNLKSIQVKARSIQKKESKLMKGDKKKKNDEANDLIDKMLSNTTINDIEAQSLLSISSQLSATGKILESMRVVKLLNEQAKIQYQHAITKAKDEAKHDREIFNQCAASLVVDSLNAQEHAFYFFPRQALDGSHKTFKNANRSTIETSVKELKDSKDPDAALKTFIELAQKISPISTEEIQEFKGGYTIDSRIKSFWACSMASSAVYSLIRWARRSQKLGGNSVEQYDKKKEIIEAGKEFLANACKGVLDKNLYPVPTALEVCNAWMEDTMFFSQKCSNNSKDVKDAEGNGWREAKLFGMLKMQDVHINNTAALEQSTSLLREFNEKYEMSPLGRAITFNTSLKRADDRIESNTRDIEALDKRKKILNKIYLQMQSIKNAQAKIDQGPIKFYLLQVINKLSQYFNKTDLFIKSAYAKITNSHKNLLGPIYPDGKKRCLYGKNGKCFSITNQTDSWIFHNSATEKSNAVDYLSARLGDSLQRGPNLTPETYRIMIKLHKYRDYIDEQYNESQKKLGEEFFNGPENFVRISNMHFNNYQTGLSQILNIDLTASLKPIIGSNKSTFFKKKRNKIKPDQAKKINTPKRKTASVASSFLRRSKNEYAHNKSDLNFKMKDLNVSKNKQQSIFKIITRRYIINYRDFENQK